MTPDRPPKWSKITPKSPYFGPKMVPKWPYIAPDRVKNGSKTVKKGYKQPKKPFKSHQYLHNSAKYTRTPLRILPGTPIYCSLSYVETSILTVLKQKKWFCRCKKACFCTFLHNFGEFRQKRAYYCLPLHHSAYFCSQLSSKK